MSNQKEPKGHPNFSERKKMTKPKTKRKATRAKRTVKRRAKHPDKLNKPAQPDSQILGPDGLPAIPVTPGSPVVSVSPRSYEPPTIKQSDSAPLLYELYPGIIGYAYKRNNGQIWIGRAEPIPEAWGKQDGMNMFLDVLSNRCRFFATWGNLYLKLYEKGWVQYVEFMTETDGEKVEIDVWRPPRDTDLPPHDGQGGPPEKIDL